ncbi:hypothetical protein [Paraburkholderia sp. MM5384-R2]|uniref:hypothetical protein n=1 Tax=Paraburkholderia sp. MM5384-R2 TaxID=2723097 RepID=UPI0016192BDC|nr:hypothetical protein [Paraburkholderia sp. MM5384-R2]MBB5496861.1 hypothetical protein [Paraburkholderia sp. MM5384-R2]
MNNFERPTVDEHFTYKLRRHLINLMCFDSGDEARKANNGKPLIYNFSAFVVELGGDWLAVTAGHIFDDLKKAISKGGRISNWQIDDSSVTDKPATPYPFHLDIDSVLYLHDDVPGMDYATFPLDALTVMALKNEGIVPVTHDLWDGDDFRQYPHWILIGTPYMPELLHGKSVYEKYIMAIQLVQRDTAPDGIEQKEYRCLFADLDWDSVDGDNKPATVDGMSGGPIFALNVVNTSDYSYKLIGVQSARNDSGSVAFCAMPPFLRALQSAALKLQTRSAGEESQ